MSGPLGLEDAARVRADGEEKRRAGVAMLMASVREHAHLGPTEIARRVTAAGWPMSRSQVNNLLRGRTR